MCTVFVDRGQNLSVCTMLHLVQSTLDALFLSLPSVYMYMCECIFKGMGTIPHKQVTLPAMFWAAVLSLARLST